MTGWKRLNSFTKAKKLSDGELLGLLVKEQTSGREQLRDELYKSVTDLDADYRKAGVALVLAFGLAALSYFDTFKTLNWSGVEIQAPIADHIALTILSLTSINFTIRNVKLSYLQSWFDNEFEKEGPYVRASLLIRYPNAYSIFKYIPTTIGYPKHIFPDSRFVYWKHLSLIILTLSALVIYIAVSIGLWSGLAYQVWNSSLPTPLFSKFLVGGAALLMVISLISPSYNSFKKRYIHFGMSNVMQDLQKRDPDRYDYYMRKINEISPPE